MLIYAVLSKQGEWASVLTSSPPYYDHFRLVESHHVKRLECCDFSGELGPLLFGGGE